jgi:SAM-dependent methyltransferase
MSSQDSPYHRPFVGPVEKRALYEYHLARDCILPLLGRWGIRLEGTRVLDLGCGTGGLAVAMAERGADCWGVDLRPERIACASQTAAEHGVTVHFLAGDILDLDRLAQLFDLIVLSEVVEHLGDLAHVGALLRWCRDHLSADGRIYGSFPPWFGPFAGHQAGWPRIRHIPWYHLLPDVLKRLLAPERVAAYLRFAQELNHLTLGSFEKHLQEAGLVLEKRELYLVRPEFRHRYGLPELRSSLLAHIPVLREVGTTGAYYLLSHAGARNATA